MARACVCEKRINRVTFFSSSFLFSPLVRMYGAWLRFLREAYGEGLLRFFLIPLPYEDNWWAFSGRSGGYRLAHSLVLAGQSRRRAGVFIALGNEAFPVQGPWNTNDQEKKTNK